MSLLMLLAGLCTVALPGLAVRVGDRLPPAEWARAVGVTITLGLVLTEVALVALALPALVSGVGGSVGPAVASAGPHLTPGGNLPGWGAAMVLAIQTAAVGSSLRAARRLRRAVRVEPGLGDRRLHGGTEVVVLPDHEMIASSAPNGQVLISSALVDALSGPELEAVVRHEVAHVRHRHHRLILLASVAAAAVPARRCLASAQTLRSAVERWADHEAAGATSEGRDLVRRALLRFQAQAAAGGRPGATISSRLRALSSAPPAGSVVGRLVLAAPLVVVVGVAGAAGLDWAAHANTVLASAVP